MVTVQTYLLNLVPMMIVVLALVVRGFNGLCSGDFTLIRSCGRVHGLWAFSFSLQWAFGCGHLVC
jgi:hypothetical protein